MQLSLAELRAEDGVYSKSSFPRLPIAQPPSSRAQPQRRHREIFQMSFGFWGMPSVHFNFLLEPFVPLDHAHKRSSENKKYDEATGNRFIRPNPRCKYRDEQHIG